MKAIINGLVVHEHEIVTGQVIMYEEDIWKIVPRKQFRAGMCTEIIDASGGFVVPGFINEHIHGCAGVDVMDEDDKALERMQKSLPQTGVTSFVATTMTYDRPRIERALGRIRSAMERSTAGARILGAHMEGPFVNVNHKGSQDAQYIQQADFSWLLPYVDILKIITFAPETLPNHHFIQQCVEHQIIPSLGHSDATYEEATAVMDEVPCCHVTHLYNAMSPLHHRKPGLVGAALLQPKARCELICDNLHVHPAAQNLAYRMKGRDGIILVTDSMRACLMPDGTSELGGQTVYVKNGEARLADGTIAASIAPMHQCVLHFLMNTGASLPDVIAMATENPAKDLGVYDRLGSLDEGKAADIVILDSTDFHVKQTIIAGELAYNEETN